MNTLHRLHTGVEWTDGRMDGRMDVRVHAHAAANGLHVQPAPLQQHFALALLGGVAAQLVLGQLLRLLLLALCGDSCQINNTKKTMDCFQLNN